MVPLQDWQGLQDSKMNRTRMGMKSASGLSCDP